MRRIARMSPLCLWFVIGALLSTPVWGANGEPVEAKGDITAVTVYRGQAMVTRTVQVADAEGAQTIVVPELPAEIVAGSLYAESTDGVIIRSVRYRTRPVTEDVREQVRELDGEIQELERQIARKDQQREVLDAQRNLLQKLEQFTAPSAEWELARGVLDAETIEQLTGYLFDQRQRISEARLTLQFEKQDLQTQLSQKQRARRELARSSSRTAREAIVFADFQQGDSFELRYLVNEATWSPSYNMRAPAERNQLTLEYLASIRQTSGEDWDGVRMTLSTASPSLASEAPTLASLNVSLADPAQSHSQTGTGRGGYSYAMGELSSDEYAQRQQAITQKLRDIEEERGRQQGAQGQQARGAEFNQSNGSVAPSADGFDNRWNMAMNDASAVMQVNELHAGRARAQSSDEEARDERTAQEVSVEYTLPGATSLPSRSDRQLVRIDSQQIEADFHRIARPLLTERVYEQAMAVNTTGNVLLAGPTQSYLDGQFVGRGSLPTVAEGESLTVGFGIDSSLHASRSLLDRSESTQGGNRVVRVIYRLTLSNFANEARQVRLFDRLPVPKRGEDIQVRLVNTSQQLAESPANDDSTITAQSDGIMRWDIEVPAGATGDNAVTVDYTFTMEYDRQKAIRGQATPLSQGPGLAPHRAGNQATN